MDSDVIYYDSVPMDYNMEEIELLNRFYGYKEGIRYIDIEKLYELSNLLFNKKTDFNYKPIYTNKKIIIKNVKKFYEKLGIYFENIKFLNEKEDDILNDFLNCFLSDNMISPYDLPITFIDDNILMCGRELHYQVLGDNVLGLQDEEICFNSIELSKSGNTLSSISYTHELMHVALLHKKGSIQDYLNNELLSIFFERLYSLYSTSKTSIYSYPIRLNSLKNDIKLLANSDNYYEKSISSSYIESTIKALYLYNLYYSHKDNIRKEIILSVNKVLDGSNTLEEMLNKFDINYTDSLEYTKKLLK